MTEDPDTLPPVEPTPPKRRVWLAVVIVVAVSVLVIGIGAVLIQKYVVGNRDTAYCQAYSALATSLPATSDQLTAAQASGNMAAVTTALQAMSTQFQGLVSAQPPVDAISPLTSITGYLENLTTFASNNDPGGYNEFVAQNASTIFTPAAGQLDAVSLEYCK